MNKDSLKEVLQMISETASLLDANDESVHRIRVLANLGQEIIRLKFEQTQGAAIPGKG